MAIYCANFLLYYGKIHSKLPIFCVKSVKIYTRQKNLHEHARGARDEYQVWKYLRSSIEYKWKPDSSMRTSDNIWDYLRKSIEYPRTSEHIKILDGWLSQTRLILDARWREGDNKYKWRLIASTPSFDQLFPHVKL